MLRREFNEYGPEMQLLVDVDVDVDVLVDVAIDPGLRFGS